MKMFLVVIFMLIAAQAYADCNVKVYKQYAVPAMEDQCDANPWGNDDPWCGKDDTPYAITWVDMLVPKKKYNTPHSCQDAMKIERDSILSETNPKLWGAKIVVKSRGIKNKWVWRNPNFKWE